MILSVQRQVHDAIDEAIRRQFGVADVPPFAIEVPPTRALGDLAVPVAFQLARTLRKAPKAIAQELAQALGAIPGVARIVATPNGYLNLYLERTAFFTARVRQQVEPERAPREKTIVEHTAINPNKAAHIGHLRNATLGDTLVRALSFRGTPVETQNYIDDTGVQVADVIVGFREIGHRTLDEVRQIADTTRFDYYCWDLYAKVTEWYDGDKTRLAIRAAVLHDLEHGGNDTAAMGTLIVDRIVRAHLKTMARLNIGYDLLTYEGDILRLQFWAHAFETLKAQGAVFLQTEGKLAGCWVMRIEEEGGASSAPTPDDGTVASNSGDGTAASRSDDGTGASNSGDGTAASRSGDGTAASRSDDGPAASNSGDGTAASRSGDGTVASRSGDGTVASRSGDGTAASRSGDGTAASRSDDGTVASRSGDGTAASRSDDGTGASNSGYGTAASRSDDGTVASNSGDGTVASNSGDGTAASRSDDGTAASRSDDGTAASNSGDGTVASNSGDGTAASRSGDGTVASNSVGAELARPDEGEETREKVIVRSNGVVTYVGKDLANQFWKFGLLGLDFRYRLFATQPDGRSLWATTSGENEPGAPPFGRAQRIYNVIDSRQMYLQALLSQALRTLGHPTEAESSIHFSYEMVTLSHATARELGYETAADGEDARKPFVEVSGRKGLGVKIDDLLDLLTNKAGAEVAKRNPAFTPEECQRVGAQIAVAAIRYFMLKFSRGKLIVFDIEEALSFEGETGPYLQYAVVRAANILHKLQDREGVSEADVLASLDQTRPDEITGESDDPTHDLWAVVFEASRLDEVVEQVVRSLEFSGLAKYAFGLAQTFNAFYHRYPILNEERADRKRWRAAGVAYVRAQLTRALDLMGIDVPNRM